MFDYLIIMLISLFALLADSDAYYSYTATDQNDKKVTIEVDRLYILFGHIVQRIGITCK